MSVDQLQDYLIVGAGISGLDLARKLKIHHDDLTVHLVDKSKSCGGRMATRRIGESKFDHGAQFLKVTSSSQDLIQAWEKENVSQAFPSVAFNAVFGRTGMTSLAKHLAKDLQISYNLKVQTIARVSGLWHVTTDQAPSFVTRNLVLTCPLPQSIDILKASNVSFDARLERIQYAKAVVFLAEFDSSLGSEMIYTESLNHDVFSVCSQAAKGLSKLHEYTIVMQPSWSEKHFENSDLDIEASGKELLLEIFSDQKILNLQVKKWRLSHPTETWYERFECAHPGLYLAGDAFGGPSINGALKSSDALFEHLMTNQFTLKS